MFKEITDFLEANRVLAPYLVFEFAQGAVREMGPIEEECIASLADLGFRFSMDHVADLRMEPRELAERGFRFVKVPAALLLNRTAAPQGDIHPADFSDLLGRFGIDLIAERIESEGTVVDLLDYDVRFGQGFLFSPPRPVRTEVLQGIADRPPAAERAPRAAAARRRASGPAGRRRRRRPRRAACRTGAPPRSRSSRAASCGARKGDGAAAVSARRSASLVRTAPAMNIAPISTDHFSTLAPHYDAVLSDVWGVVHNGVAAFPAAGEALTRFREKGGAVVADLERAAPGRAGHPACSTAWACRARPMTRSSPRAT